MSIPPIIPVKQRVRRKRRETASVDLAPVTVVADPATCSFQLKLTGTEAYTTPCDVAKSTLVARSVNYSDDEDAPQP